MTERCEERVDRLGWCTPESVIYLSKSAVGSIAKLPSGNAFSRTMTRALGRVLAHELAHRFLTGAQHTESGLSKAVLTRDDLIYVPREALALGPAQPDLLRGAFRAADDSTGRETNAPTRELLARANRR